MAIAFVMAGDLVVAPIGISVGPFALGQSTFGPPYQSTGLPAAEFSGRAVPRAPRTPRATSRPDGWPGAGNAGGSSTPPAQYRQANLSQSPFHVAPQAAAGPPLTPVEGAKILARIDTDVILFSEVAGLVNQTIAANIERYQGQLTPAQEKMVRDAVLQKAVASLIPNKLLVADARRTIPAENLPQVMEQFEDTFEKSELPKMIERAGLKDRHELDAMLRGIGTSLSREKRAFAEKTLAQQWLRQQLDFDREIPYQDLDAYYQEHLADYEQPAKVRWQQLSKKPARYQRQETEAEIQRLGNELLRGAPFDQVVQAHSDGPSASQGGWYDWTTLDANDVGEFHVSQELRAALAQLPVNRLSPIIKDDQGYHIVRVVERKPATRTPLAEVQADIRDTLRRQRVDQQVQEYIARLKEQATIWTVFDDMSGEHRVTGRPGASSPY